MTYLRSPASVSGCACRSKATGLSGVMEALGAILDPTQIKAIGAPSGVDPVVYLRAQLNRYTAQAGAPIAFQYATTQLPLTSSLDGDVAARALWILNMRAGYASTMTADPATAALLQTYGSAWSNPVAYVEKNLSAVIDVVRLFGDSKGLPKAVGVAETSIIGDLSPQKIAIAGGLAVVGYLVLTRKKRGRR